MSILKHFLFFTLEGNLEFKKLKDSFCLYDDSLYKLDIIDNELYFLKASLGRLDIEYQTSSLKLDDVKSKSLKYKRVVASSKLIESFNNFYVCTMLDESSQDGLKFSEYERLKIFLTYGLKAKDLSISIGLALRIYMFYLSINSKSDEIKKLLDLFSFIYQENIVDTIKNANEFYDNLSCIILDDANFYTNECAKVNFTKIFSKVLRKEAIKVLRYEENTDKLILLLDFLSFFKSHKKLDLSEKLLKNKAVKKTARKISKIARTYYLG